MMAAGISLFVLATIFLGVMLLLPLVVWQGYRLLMREGLRLSPCAIVTVQQNREAVWRLMRKDGEEILARDCGNAVRSSWITIISLKTIPLGKPLRLIIPRDAMQMEQYQTLTARLWS